LKQTIQEKDFQIEAMHQELAKTEEEMAQD
jgi:hypothetical protein